MEMVTFDIFMVCFAAALLLFLSELTSDLCKSLPMSVNGINRWCKVNHVHFDGPSGGYFYFTDMDPLFKSHGASFTMKEGCTQHEYDKRLSLLRRAFEIASIKGAS